MWEAAFDATRAEWSSAYGFEPASRRETSAPVIGSDPQRTVSVRGRQVAA